jgi:hypothetical protein
VNAVGRTGISTRMVTRINHSIEFVDKRTGAHTNTTESAWRHVTASLSPYNRKGEYIFHLAHYMFAARCKAEKVHPFTKFIYLVANVDWSVCALHSESRAT